VKSNCRGWRNRRRFLDSYPARGFVFLILRNPESKATSHPRALAFPLSLNMLGIDIQNKRAIMLHLGPAFFQKLRGSSHLRNTKARKIQQMKRQKKRGRLELTSGGSRDEKLAALHNSGLHYCKCYGCNPSQWQGPPTDGNSYYYSSDWFHSPQYGSFRKVVLLHGNWWGNAVLLDDEVQDAYRSFYGADSYSKVPISGPDLPPAHNPDKQEMTENKVVLDNSQQISKGDWRGLPERAHRNTVSVSITEKNHPLPAKKHGWSDFGNGFGAPVPKFNATKSRPVIEMLLYVPLPLFHASSFH
jgi:hypothetical protein